MWFLEILRDGATVSPPDGYTTITPIGHGEPAYLLAGSAVSGGADVEARRRSRADRRFTATSAKIWR